MLIQQHIEQLIKLAAPHVFAFNPALSAGQISDQKLHFTRLLSQIKPVKFGNDLQWDDAGFYTLAQMQTPRNSEYLCVMRVECYVVNRTSGAADYGIYEPPPPGTAYWQYTPAGTGNATIVSDELQPAHNMLDVDEFRFFKQGQTVSLIGNFLVSPDGMTRSVCTRVYAYQISSEIMERIGGVDIYEPPGQGL